MWWCTLTFLHKNDVRFVFTSSCLQEGSRLIVVLCIFGSINVQYFTVALLFSFLSCVFSYISGRACCVNKPHQNSEWCWLTEQTRSDTNSSASSNVMGIDQSMWRQAHHDVTDENNYELKVSTYNITDIAAWSTGLDTKLMMMTVSNFKADARLYILVLLY